MRIKIICLSLLCMLYHLAFSREVTILLRTKKDEGEESFQIENDKGEDIIEKDSVDEENIMLRMKTTKSGSAALPLDFLMMKVKSSLSRIG